MIFITKRIIDALIIALHILLDTLSHDIDDASTCNSVICPNDVMNIHKILHCVCGGLEVFVCKESSLITDMYQYRVKQCLCNECITMPRHGHSTTLCQHPKWGMIQHYLNLF